MPRLAPPTLAARVLLWREVPRVRESELQRARQIDSPLCGVVFVRKNYDYQVIFGNDVFASK